MISFSKWSFPSIGQDVYVYDIVTKTVKTKTWPDLPLCTSAFRWAEHYYCFHGHNFTRFNPVSGEVSGTYPKDARNYFMKCENFGGFIKKRILEIHFGGFFVRYIQSCVFPAGHGGDHKAPKCSEVKLDAITTDDRGRIYLFTGNVTYVSNSQSALT